jgi:hypothetical protein
LCIDTEGYDYWILKNIDIKKYNIETIECEYWAHDIDCTEEIKTGPKFFENEILPKYSKFYNISKCTRDSMDTHTFIKIVEKSFIINNLLKNINSIKNMFKKIIFNFLNIEN